MKCTKTILASLLLTLTTTMAIAQEKWSVELNDGTKSVFYIDDIKEIYTEDGSKDQEHENTPSSTSVTGGVSGITAVSATMQGYANNVVLGGTTYVGICYSSTNTTPTTDDLTLTRSSVGSDNSYSVVATKLAPATTYYYRAYVYSCGLVQYAASTYSFTTPSTDDIVTTGSASNITNADATISISFNLPTSAYSSITCGVCYSATNPSPTTSDTKVAASLSSCESYIVSLTGLSNSTIYYYRSYIIADGRIIYGETRSFNTVGVNATSPYAITGDIAGAIVKTSVDLTCIAYLNSLDLNAIELGVCWSKKDTIPTLDNYTARTQKIGTDKKYVVSMTGLREDATYYYRAYIKNNDDVYYGQVKTFKTTDTFYHEYVEIEGIKWATMNVGATTVAGSPATCYGDYFANEEIEPRYTSIKINGANSVSFGGWYSELRGHGYHIGVGFYYDGGDVAKYNWGKAWCKPTYDDFYSLIYACVGKKGSLIPQELSTSNPTAGIYWLTADQNYLPEYKGVAGMLYVAIKDKKKRVFFPAAGKICDTTFSEGGKRGNYWSSTRPTTQKAWEFCLKSSGVTNVATDYTTGFSVRPVSHYSSVESITLDKKKWTITRGNHYTLTAAILPTNAANKTLSWLSSDTSVATVNSEGEVTAVNSGIATITVTANDGFGACTTCTIIVTEHETSQYPGVYEYVDLGLSVKWATCNIGASSPEEYGDYFAWGETEGYSISKLPFSVSTHKHFDGSQYKIIKYTISENDYTHDGKRILEATDDAATVYWGSNWRMPTADECLELCNTDNCTWTWYESGNPKFKGVAGYKVQSKKSGYEDKYIFLPANGCISYGELSVVGQYATFWSSSLSENHLVSTQAKYACGPNQVGEDYRWQGQAIRPVLSAVAGDEACTKGQ